jgi:cytochrome c biogenesis protein
MKKMLKETIDYLSSVRLTVIILIAIAVLSAIATFVVQNAPPEEYILRFGHTAFKILSLLSVTDIFHSPYFNALLMLLVMNITLCTLSLAPRKITGLFRSRPRESGYPLAETQVSRRTERETVQIISKALRRPLCRTSVTVEGKDTTIISAPPALFSLGAVVVHVSILMIIVGGLLSSLFGFSGEMNIIEGGRTREVFLDRTHLVQLDFSVRLNRFTFDRYPDGTPKEYRSDITIIQGENQTDASVTVNHPVKYRGVRFYQTSFGKEMDYATIEVLDSMGNSLYVGEAYWSIPVQVPGRDLTFTIVQSAPEFMDFGPAVQLSVKDTSGQYKLWTLVRYPEFDRARGGDYVFVLKDYHLVPYSSFTVVREPGLPLVFTGFILICVGFLFPLVSSLGTFRGRISRRDKTIQVTIEGAPGRLTTGFSGLFDRRVDEIRKKLC